MFTGLIKRLPLRVRLTVWVVGIAVIIQASVGMLFYLYQRKSVSDFFNDYLQRRSDAMMERIQVLVPEVTVADLEAIAAAESKHAMFHGFILTIYKADGSLLVSTRQTQPNYPISPEQLRDAVARQSTTFRRVPAREVQRFDPEATMARGIVRGFTAEDGKRYALTIVTADSYAEQLIGLVAWALAVSVPTGILVSGICGWYIAGLAMRPLQSVTQTAARMTPESIGRERMILPRSSPEQEKAELELNRAMDRLAAAFAAQERFMSNVSHELKTPIAVLMTEAQTLDARNAPREVVAYIRSSMDELRRLGSMVDSFLLLTRVREGRTLTQHWLYPLNELVMESVSHCQSMAAQYKVSLVPRLCEDREEIMTLGDPALLRTMIDNLVRNAIRFSPEGGKVNVVALKERNHLLVRVRDRGPGIPESIIKRIFDRFVQAPEEHRRGRGHGLGLEIAQGIAELHGGRIEARNCSSDAPCGDGDVTCGCEFTVRLPVGAAQRDIEKERERSAPSSRSSDQTQSAEPSAVAL